MTTFSQKDINKICFSYVTAKKIAVDLVKGDSAIAELDKTNQLIFDLLNKSNRQDSIIRDFKTKDFNFSMQIQNYNQIGEQQSIIIRGLETDVSKLQKSNNRLKKGLKWLSRGLVTTLASSIVLLLIR